MSQQLNYFNLIKFDINIAFNFIDKIIKKCLIKSFYYLYNQDKTIINLVNEKSLNDLLYSKTTAQYAGVSGEMTPIEAEYEFYKRLLVNLSYIYKSKGTRKSLEFFLMFLGAPEPLIKINQYVYEIKSLPNSPTLESDILDVISGLDYKNVINFCICKKQNKVRVTLKTKKISYLYYEHFYSIVTFHLQQYTP